MSFDFSHLDIFNATTWCDLDDVCPGARVCVRPATDANPAYFNALLKKAGSRARRASKRGGIPSLEDHKIFRMEDRELFPKHVIVAWEGVRDSNNELVPFSADAVTEFCQKLPDFIFDQIRAIASTPQRFLADDEDPVDTEAILGN